MGLTRDRTTKEEEHVMTIKELEEVGGVCGLSNQMTKEEVERWQRGTLKAVAPDNVNHPPHYNNSQAKCECGRRIECIDVTRHLSFNIGNAIKYLWRCDLKSSPIEDLRKAVWYIQDEIKNRLK